MIEKVKNVIRTSKYARFITKGVKSLINQGLYTTLSKVNNKLRYARQFKRVSERPLYSEEELEAQRRETFSIDIKISILVPLYNTPERFLREMIQSVIDQTYANWELCLADGSDTQHSNVGQVSMEYAQKDTRICYRKLEKNMGISGNTNACIEMSTGSYIALFDHDDLLHPAALYEVMKKICEKDADFVYTDEAVFESPDVRKVLSIHFKPDFAVDNLRANNYICHLNVFQRELLERAGGGFRSEYDGSQDHDLMLRLTAEAKHIEHVSKVLYYWRSHPLSVAQDISAKTYAITAGRNAVRDSISRSGYRAEVDSSDAFPTIYRIKYELKKAPKVSILIVSQSNTKNLSRCIQSIQEKTTYNDYEIIIVRPASEDPKVQSYCQSLEQDKRIHMYASDCHRFGALSNFAAQNALGDYYLFLHADTQIITPNWIEELMMYAQRDDVAAVGGMLYYPNNTIQHAGMILGMGPDGIAGNIFRNTQRGSTGYMGRLHYAQNMSAVSGACMLVKASVFQEVGGFDKELTDTYGDVDLCLKIRRAGYLIVWTPHAELYHYESKRQPKQVQEEEAVFFRKRWARELAAGDPYYNPNFTLDRVDFTLR